MSLGAGHSSACAHLTLIPETCPPRGALVSTPGRLLPTLNPDTAGGASPRRTGGGRGAEAGYAASSEWFEVAAEGTAQGGSPFPHF